MKSIELNLLPELQYQKSQLMLLAGEIRQIAKHNLDNSVIDQLGPGQSDRLSQAAGVVVNTFLQRGFRDPKIGQCIGRFIATNLADVVTMRWQAPSGYVQLMENLLQQYWYPKGIDVAISYENDGHSLTNAGAAQRWYQETVDNANLLEYLSAHIGYQAAYSSEEFKNILLGHKQLDFRSFEEIVGAIAAISCQDQRFLQFVATDSEFLQACYPYHENEEKAQAIFGEIRQLIENETVSGLDSDESDKSFDVNCDDHEAPEFDSNIELTNRTASGLYGVVWEGYQLDLKRKVAVKIIKEDMQHAAGALAHARALARVNHPNLVIVHAVTRVMCPGLPKPVDGIVMEWIEGETLAQRLKGTFTASQVIHLSSSIADAVQCLHDAKIVHGDLHAENALITGNTVKIIDIDVAKEYSVRLATSANRSDLIQTDVNGVAFLIRQMIRKSALPIDRAVKLDDELRQAKSISRIAELISAIKSVGSCAEFTFDNSELTVHKNESTTKSLYFPHYSSSGDVSLSGNLLCKHTDNADAMAVSISLSFREQGKELFDCGASVVTDPCNIDLAACKWITIEIDAIAHIGDSLDAIERVDEVWIKFRLAGSDELVESKLLDFDYSNLDIRKGAPITI